MLLLLQVLYSHETLTLVHLKKVPCPHPHRRTVMKALDFAYYWLVAYLN